MKFNGLFSSSLTTRLMWRITLLTICFMVLLSTYLSWQFINHVNTLRDRDLEGQAHDILKAVNVSAEGEFTLSLPQQLVDVYATGKGMYRYLVFENNNTVLFSSHPGDTLYANINSPKVPSDNQVELFSFPMQNAGDTLPFYGAQISAAINGHFFFVQVAQGPTHSDALIDTFLAELWEDAGKIVLVIFGIILLVIYVTVRNSLKPLTHLSHEASQIGPNNLALRLNSDNLLLEAEPLVHAFNQALDRIAEGYSMQREFTANAAHELRTPLAILRSHVDTLPTDTAIELVPDIESLQRLVTQLLRMAQSDTLRIAESETANISHVARDIAMSMAPVAIQNGFEIEVIGADEPVHVNGNSVYLDIALRNLVDNALSASPEKGTVTIVVDAAGILRVMDQGPGVPQDKHDIIFERFRRLHNNASSGSEGAGLGLSIVKSIVDAHDAEITIDEVSGSGACFTITLRLMPRHMPDSATD